MDKKVSIGICIVAIIVIVVCCIVFACKKNKEGNNVSNENTNQVEETEYYTFVATVIGVEGKRLKVEARDGDEAAVTAGTIVVVLGEDKNEEFKVGDEVKVTYNGQMTRSEPPQVFAIKIEKVSSSDTVKNETFTAVVTKVEEKRLTVEVKDVDNTSGLKGTVIVLLGDDKAQEFKVEDKVKVTFSGQVMLSEPPQVHAIKIEKVNLK